MTELIPWKSSDESRSVEHVEPPSDDEFRRRYLRRPRPVVLTGLATRVTSLGIDELCARFGDRRIPMVQMREGLMGYGHERGTDYDERTVAELVSSFADTTPSHFMTAPLKRDFPELLEEIRLPDCSRRAPWRDTRLNVGTTGVTTPIHVELAHNLLIVVSGEKEVCLFPPRQTAHLYFAPFSAAPHMSPVSPFALDERKYPRARRLRPWRTVARAGDVLFIPRGWWHAVRTRGPSLAIASWWADGPWALLSLAAEWYRDARRLRT